MKQKLGIIQAIMENQNLLVLDEPFNALDEKSVKLFRELLIEYKKQEKLIMICPKNSPITEQTSPMKSPIAIIAPRAASQPIRKPFVYAMIASIIV